MYYIHVFWFLLWFYLPVYDGIMTAVRQHSRLAESTSNFLRSTFVMLSSNYVRHVRGIRRPARQKLFDVTTFYAGYVQKCHVNDVHEKGLSGIIIRLAGTPPEWQEKIFDYHSVVNNVGENCIEYALRV